MNQIRNLISYDILESVVPSTNCCETVNTPKVWIPIESPKGMVMKDSWVVQKKNLDKFISSFLGCQKKNLDKFISSSKFKILLNISFQIDGILYIHPNFKGVILIEVFHWYHFY